MRHMIDKFTVIVLIPILSTLVIPSISYFIDDWFRKEGPVVNYFIMKFVLAFFFGLCLAVTYLYMMNREQRGKKSLTFAAGIIVMALIVMIFFLQKAAIKVGQYVILINFDYPAAAIGFYVAMLLLLLFVKSENVNTIQYEGARK